MHPAECVSTATGPVWQHLVLPEGIVPGGEQYLDESSPMTADT